MYKLKAFLPRLKFSFGTSLSKIPKNKIAIHAKELIKWQYAEKKQLSVNEFKTAVDSLTNEEDYPFLILDIREKHEKDLFNLPNQNLVSVEILNFVRMGLQFLKESFFLNIFKKGILNISQRIKLSFVCAVMV
jgi:hypothetical protein